MNDTFTKSKLLPKQNIPKTLIVDLSLNYGGSTSRVLSLLSRFPHGYVYLAGLEGSAITREAQKLGLPVWVVGRRKTDPRIVVRLIQLIRDNNIQVLDSQNIQSKLYASLASIFTRTTLVSTINSWYASEHGGKSVRGYIYTALELATNWKLSLYITVSKKDQQALLKSGIKQGNIELIYNAFELQEEVTAIEDKWLHARLKLSPDKVLCTAVGRLVPIKGYDILIEAIEQACKEIPHLACIIIGDGEMRDKLATQIQEKGLAGHVILAGYFDRNEVLAALKTSDLFVMPSRYEGTPIALLEAATLACPILASATGGIPELVTNGEHAMLVAPEDPRALANGIIALCKDRKFAINLGKNAKRHVDMNFDFKTQVSATQHTYQKAWSKYIKE